MYVLRCGAVAAFPLAQQPGVPSSSTALTLPPWHCSVSVPTLHSMKMHSSASIASSRESTVVGEPVMSYPYQSVSSSPSSTPLTSNGLPLAFTGVKSTAPKSGASSGSSQLGAPLELLLPLLLLLLPPPPLLLLLALLLLELGRPELDELDELLVPNTWPEEGPPPGLRRPPDESPSSIGSSSLLSTPQALPSATSARHPSVTEQVRRRAHRNAIFSLER